MEQVKTSRELGFGEPKVGYQWDVGSTPRGNEEPGQWTVRRDPKAWVVLFHSFKGTDYIIQTFSPTEEGERAAKTMAVKLVKMAHEAAQTTRGKRLSNQHGKPSYHKSNIHKPDVPTSKM